MYFGLYPSPESQLRRTSIPSKDCLLRNHMQKWCCSCCGQHLTINRQMSDARCQNACGALFQNQFHGNGNGNRNGKLSIFHQSGKHITLLYKAQFKANLRCNSSVSAFSTGVREARAGDDCGAVFCTGGSGSCASQRCSCSCGGRGGQAEAEREGVGLRAAGEGGEGWVF